MRLLRYLLPLAGAVALVSSGAPAHAQGAHPSVLGLSGDLLSPTNDFVGARQYALNAHLVTGGDDIRIFSGNYGVSNRLEIGVAVFDVGTGPFDQEVIFNAKWLLMREGDGDPVTVSIGAVDLTDEIGLDPGIYIYASKNVSRWFGAEREAGSPGSVEIGAGIGGGIYHNLVVNGRLVLTRDLTVFAEFFDDQRIVDTGTTLNVGGRLAFGQQLAVVLALYDLSDLGIGISWRSGGRSE